MQTNKIVIAKKHISQFSKHNSHLFISENEPAIVKFLVQKEIDRYSYEGSSKYSKTILYFLNAVVEQEKIIGRLEREHLFAAWLQHKKDAKFLAVYNTSADEITVERTLLEPELFGNLFHMEHIATLNKMIFGIFTEDGTWEWFNVASCMVSSVRFEVKIIGIAVFVSFVSTYRMPFSGSTMHCLEFDAVKMEMKKEYYKHQAYSLKGNMNIMNSVLAISNDKNEHKKIPVNATISMPGWYIKGDFTNDTNSLIIPTTVWQKFLGILGVNPVFTLKEWTIRYTDADHIRTYGKLVFVTPVPLQFAGIAVLVSYLDVSEFTITMHCSFGMNSITLNEKGTFTANYHHSRNFLLSEPLLQQFGYTIQFNELYRHLIGSELNCTFHGKLDEQNLFKIQTVSNAYATIEPQKIVTFVFQSLWEITIPQSTLAINFNSTTSLKLQYDDSKMSYSSWKVCWLFHSASTIICTTGSSTTSILTATSNINMTIAQLFGIAKRILPSSISSTISSSYLTSIRMNIVTKELEAKNEHATITWCNESDSFACKMGSFSFAPNYDTTKKLLPLSPFSDVTFTFYWHLVS